MKRLLPLILCLSLCLSLFTGCNLVEEDPYVPTGNALVMEDDDAFAATAPVTDAAVQELTLTYYPEVTMNPYFCTDFTNKALHSLLYQGLFSVDRNYNVEPVLVSHYYVSDTLTTYTFYLDGKATFSDGSRVTPEDVRTSLISALSSKIYSGRFSRVLNVSVLDDGGISVDLDTAYENFPLLLDVPILKTDQQTDKYPIGTGPYMLSQVEGEAMLIRRANWWCNSNLIITAPIIKLLPAENPYQIRDEFQFGDLDLVQAEPGSDKYVEYLCDYELWNSESGIFMYLTCHKDSYVFHTPELRAALTYAIDRAYIAKEFYKGFADPVTLPASPLFPYYNTALASQYEYDPEKFAQIISQNGLTGVETTLVVCREDTMRLKVAEAIADMLTAGGLVVRVLDYDAENIEYALVATDYDLYLGQTILSPNMDLSEFYDMDGNLSYAGLSDMTMYNLCLQALENHGNYYTLHYNTMKDGHFCPVVFRSYAVYAARGLLTDLTPSRNNVFYYSIGKSLEQALIEN